MRSYSPLFRGPNSRLMFQIIGAMAEFERGLIQERVVAGIKNARERGVQWGRRRVDVDVIRARRLRAEGRSWREVARALHVGIGTLYRNGCQAHGRRHGKSRQKHAA